MYSCVTIVYGIPLTSPIEKVYDEVLDMLPGIEDDGHFHTMYSGAGGSMPGYCGLDLGGFDAISNIAIKDSQLFQIGESGEVCPNSCASLEITDSEKQIAAELCAALPQEVKDVALPIGIYLIWSTS